MRTILVIIFICSFQIAFCQNDSAKLYWENGNIKTLVIKSIDTIPHKDSIELQAIGLIIEYFDTNGTKISESNFFQRYETISSSQIDLLVSQLMHYNNTDDYQNMKSANEEIENLYTQSIRLGDNHFFTKDYSIALKHYKNATLLKPDETYPQIQIEELNKLIKKRKRKAQKP